MIITQISQQKKKGRFNLFIDNVFYSGIGAEAIVKNGLKVGLEISKQKLDEIIFDSESRAAFERLLNMITKQMYTKFEIKQKLFKHGFSELVIQSAIQKAEEYGYVNDENYAKLMVESKKSRSKTEIKAILFKKGINNQTINEQVSVIDEFQEKENALTFAEKYMKNKEVNQKTLAGLYGYLTRKGFTSSVVSNALRKYKFDEFGD